MVGPSYSRIAATTEGFAEASFPGLAGLNFELLSDNEAGPAEK